MLGRSANGQLIDAPPRRLDDIAVLRAGLLLPLGLPLVRVALVDRKFARPEAFRPKQLAVLCPWIFPANGRDAMSA